MPVTVELQDMFSYSLWRLVLVVVVVIIIGLIGVMVFFRKKKTQKPEIPVPAPVQAPAPKPISGNQLKEKYFAIISDLEMKCRNGKISDRKAYQELSGIARNFVYEVTGIKVHHNTLDEIRKLNMPNLYALIEECYTPEFSVDKNGNIYDTINKARMVIREWH